jgi:hypothetical protein
MSFSSHKMARRGLGTYPLAATASARICLRTRPDRTAPRSKRVGPRSPPFHKSSGSVWPRAAGDEAVRNAAAMSKSLSGSDSMRSTLPGSCPADTNCSAPMQSRPISPNRSKARVVGVIIRETFKGYWDGSSSFRQSASDSLPNRLQRRSNSSLSIPSSCTSSTPLASSRSFGPPA